MSNMDTLELRHKIATSTRILVKERMIGPFGHSSARVEGTDLIAVLGHTHDDIKDLSQTVPDDVVIIDIDGQVTEGTLDPPGERFIHTEIYRTRPDVKAVVHAHPMGCIAFSIAGAPLRPIWHLCTVFADGIPVHQSSVQIDEIERGQEVAAAIGDHRAILLKGHGLVVVGASIEEATVNAVNLERSARLQATVAAIGDVHEIPQTELNDDSLTIGLTKHEYVDAQWDYWSIEAGA